MERGKAGFNSVLPVLPGVSVSLEEATMWSEDGLDRDPVGSVMEVDKNRGMLVGVMRSPGGLVSGEEK